MPASVNRTFETILVVDDEPSVLKVVVALLESEGFVVLSAACADDALKISRETVGPIDMLLSDVDMAEMSGPDLGEAMKKLRPALHVMLMSGGGNGNLLVLNYGWAYIQKPLVAQKLVQMINRVLHSKNRSQLGGQEFDTSKDSK